jgi:hypothetical protein
MSAFGGKADMQHCFLFASLIKDLATPCDWIVTCAEIYGYLTQAACTSKTRSVIYFRAVNFVGGCGDMQSLKANRTSLTKLFFVALGCSVLAMPAVAADLPIKAPTPAPVATVYSWAGPYVGVNAGVVWGRSDQTSAPSAGLADPAQIPVTLSVLLPRLQGTRNFDTSFTGGAQIGYNWQFNQWVFGLEADFNYVGLDNTFAFSAPTSSSGTSVTVAQSTSVDWLATFRGRLGFAINNVLLYGTGGLAVGKVGFDSAIGMIFSGGTSSGFSF